MGRTQDALQRVAAAAVQRGGGHACARRARGDGLHLQPLLDHVHRGVHYPGDALGRHAGQRVGGRGAAALAAARLHQQFLGGFVGGEVGGGGEGRGERHGSEARVQGAPALGAHDARQPVRRSAICGRSLGGAARRVLRPRA